jgi:hypothetical protein
MSLSWKPIMYGLNYCAPACGHGCTLAQFDAAHAAALGLATELGDGWLVDVWENLGWHWGVNKGGIKVRQNHGGCYTAFLGLPGELGGRWAESGKTPQEAIRNSLCAAEKDIGMVGNILESCRKELKK